MSKPSVVELGLSFLFSTAVVAACSGSSSSDGSGGSGGSAGTSSGGGGGATGGGGGAAGSDSGAPSCGSLGVCVAGTACVEEVFEPTCENLTDPNADCPAGKTKSMCGGAGFPCCCDPPPESQYACQPTTACKGSVDCSCITCPSNKMCTPTAAGPFRCEDPPKP
ncbi:MAG: hypothetical protein IPM35_35800 [Myxococcales bacterium]|nr:hypothetical protein [Myxococcales bacterium]